MTLMIAGSCTAAVAADDQTLHIDFQDGFRQDVFVVKFQDREHICTMSSNLSLGLAISFRLPKPDKPFELRVEEIHGEPVWTGTIDPDEGLFIGFNIKDGKFSFLQRKEAFLYF